MPSKFKVWTTAALKEQHHEFDWLVGRIPGSAKDLEKFLDDFFLVTQQPGHTVEYSYSLGRVGDAERVTVWNDQGVGVVLDPIPISDLFGVPRTGRRRYVHTSDRNEQ
jgi:hypothetical protein